MTVLRIPRGAWGWRCQATVLLLMLVPIVAVLQLTSSTHRLPQVAALRTVVIAAALLSATIAFYVHHRVIGLNQSGWLTTALGLAALPTLTFGIYSFAHPQQGVDPIGWSLVYQLAQMALMLSMLLLAGRVRMPVDALALGLVLGLILSVIRPLTMVSAPPDSPSVAGLALGGTVLGLVTLATGLPILGLVSLPPWLRARSFLALGLFGVSTTLDPAATRNPLAAAVALLTGVVGSLLVTTTTAAYLHLALIARREEVTQLEQQLARVESGMRADRARLHEIDSTVAGIASASRLMYSTPDLSESRRDVLAGMMAAEVARLQRLTADPLPGRPAAVALDDVLGRLALDHRSRGCRIDWSDSGLHVVGSEDGVTRVLDELLHNAAIHGSPEQVRVAVQQTAGEAVVTVADDGPGVPPAARSRLFEDPPDLAGGSSLSGLPGARVRARAMGGDLWLQASRTGARFVLRLTLAPESPTPIDDRTPRPSLMAHPSS